MARSPLIIQTPQQSLITGNQLPKASGAGVPIPDIQGAFARLGTKIKAKSDRNQALASQLEGQRAAAEFTGKDANGNYIPLPGVDWAKDADYNAAHLNTAENNTRSTIQRDALTRFNEIMLGEGTDAEKLARMEGAGNGFVAGVPDDFKSYARTFVQSEIEQRRATMANQALQRQRTMDIEGVRTRIEDANNMAISGAASGADISKHKNEMMTAYDDLVELQVIDQETADRMKVRTLDFIGAMGAQRGVAMDLFAGNVDPAELDAFAEALRAGGDAELQADENFAPTAFNIERERAGNIQRRTIYSTTKLRESFRDPKTVEGVANEFSRLAAYQAQRLKSYEKEIGLFNTINGLQPEQSLPVALRDDLNKTFDAMIAKGAFEDPGGLATMEATIQRTKVMPKSFVDYMSNTILNGDLDAAGRMIETWNRIRKRSLAGRRSGETVLRTMSGEDIAFLDAATEAWKQLGSLEDKAAQDRWDRFTKLSSEKGKDLDASIAAYNDANRGAYGMPITFGTALRNRFNSEYGINMPADFEAEFKQAFHITSTMSSTSDPNAAFEKTWEIIRERFAAAPIYKSGIVRGQDLTNPDDYARTADDVFGASVDPYQWVNDYTKYEIDKMLDAGMIEASPLQIAQIREIISEPLPLGTSMWLSATDTTSEQPQFEIVVGLPDGDMRLRIVKDGVDQPLLVDPGIVRAHRNSKVRTRKEAEAEKQRMQNRKDVALDTRWMENLKTSGDLHDDRLGFGDWSAFTEAPSMMTQEQRDKWFLSQPEDWQKQYMQDRENDAEALEKNLKRVLDQEIKLPAGTDIGPPDLISPKAAGPEITKSAIAQIDRVLPDGTGGAFLMNIASVESDFGRAEGTFRAAGDVGIMQINTGDYGAFKEVQRRARIPGDPIQRAAEKLKAVGVDVAGMTKSDLYKPLHNVAIARLYMLADNRPIPADVEGQAQIWKDHYNTEAGAGTVSDFISKAGRYAMDSIVGSAEAAPYSLSRGVPGAITDMSGNANPANFLATSPTTQAAALRLSSVFGKELRVTPHGGTQPDARSSTSQHKHGKALDIYVEDYPDAEKTRLIATAIAMGWRGIGGYARGDGKGTVHLDLRSGGNGPGGLGVWWRNTPGKDGSWTDGPEWFRQGIRLGLQMRAQNG